MLRNASSRMRKQTEPKFGLVRVKGEGGKLFTGRLDLKQINTKQTLTVRRSQQTVRPWRATNSLGGQTKRNLKTRDLLTHHRHSPAWKPIRLMRQKVPWDSVVWFHGNVPNWVFISWLAFLKKS